MAEQFMTIDGIKVPIRGERNVLEVARNNGIDIPSLCYDPDLSIYGGCRLCIVENERGGIDASCSMIPRDEMVIYTNTPKLRKHRKMILELLLASHNCDCPTCEKDGACKLQAYARRYGVKRVRFDNDHSKLRIDRSSKAIVRDPGKCVLCGECVRVCQEIQNVSAIDFANRGSEAVVSTGFHKPIAETNCVNCGQCAAICPTGAISIKNEVDEGWKAIQDPEYKTVVQVAPAVRAGVGEVFGLPAGANVIGKIVTALKRMGVDEVYDTSLSADITIMEESAEFLEKLKTGAKLPMFTSCCPGWIKHVENAHPELMPQVSTTGSPMEIFGALIRRYFKKNEPERKIYSIAVMPCTAKKYEASRPELVKDGERLIDLVLTTQELCRMIKEAGIDFASLPDTEPDAPFAPYTGGGVIFGVTGGVTEAVIRKVVGDVSEASLKEIADCGVRGLEGIKSFEVTAGETTLKIAVANGLKNADRVIEAVQKGEASYDFIEVMACPNGCIGGAGQPSCAKPVKTARFRGMFEADEACELRSCEQNPALDYIYREVIGERAHDLFHVHYPDHKNG